MATASIILFEEKIFCSSFTNSFHYSVGIKWINIWKYCHTISVAHNIFYKMQAIFIFIFFDAKENECPNITSSASNNLSHASYFDFKQKSSDNLDFIRITYDFLSQMMEANKNLFVICQLNEIYLIEALLWFNQVVRDSVLPWTKLFKKLFKSVQLFSIL